MRSNRPIFPINCCILHHKIPGKSSVDDRKRRKATDDERDRAAHGSGHWKRRDSVEKFRREVLLRSLKLIGVLLMAVPFITCWFGAYFKAAY